jgi:hypothetical protein
MQADQLKPNVMVYGPIFPAPVQVITTIPMGESIKLIGKRLKSGKVHDPVLSREQLATLENKGDRHNYIPNLRFAHEEYDAARQSDKNQSSLDLW